MIEISDSSDWTPGAGSQGEWLTLGNINPINAWTQTRTFAGEKISQEAILLIPEKKPLCEDKEGNKT